MTASASGFGTVNAKTIVTPTFSPLSTQRIGPTTFNRFSQLKVELTLQRTTKRAATEATALFRVA
jgi:hypothetical protein